MNDNAKQWVAALRSGEYLQTRGHLHDDKGFCCLGVACDLYAKEHPEAVWKDGHGGLTFLGRSSVLPQPVASWIGLKELNGSAAMLFSLASLNDDGKSFEAIANIIDSEPPGLFAEEQAA